MTSLKIRFKNPPNYDLLIEYIKFFPNANIFINHKCCSNFKISQYGIRYQIIKDTVND